MNSGSSQRINDYSSEQMSAADLAALDALLAFAVRIARDAGEITIEYFRESRHKLLVSRKADGSFVTAADREAERFLRDAIAREYPNDGVLGEEEGEHAGTSGRRWILDPIDGTFSFVHGVPLYGVLIGLEVGDQPTLGVVNLPALNELIYARKGGGCYLNGDRVQTTATASLEEALLLGTDFGVCEKYGFGAQAAELQRRAHARRTWGDAYGHVLVATGRADIMLDPVMNIWDCAPLLPILEEAGGTFTDWQGHRTIHGGNAISTNGKLFEQVLSVASKQPLPKA